MADVSTGVYDILFPSPPALKDIAAISMAVQLWRQEINTHRIKNTLDKLNLQENILSNNPTPRVSAAALSLIEQYVKQVGFSIKKWLESHSYLNLFKTDILNDFIDFVADFDGTIHYERTALRIVSSDQIDDVVRLQIACTYCFEDDVSRIWSSVSSKIHTIRDPDTRNYLLFYRICRLKNQLYKLPPRLVTDDQYTREFFVYRSFRWSSFKYFWNGLDEDRKTSIISKLPSCLNFHYRYLLSKFNETELNNFANSKGYDIMATVLCNNYVSGRPQGFIYIREDFLDAGPYIIAFWEYIKNKMNENNFFRLVRRLIEIPRSPPCVCGPSTRYKLWNSAPDHLKLHAIRQILIQNSLFGRSCEIDVSFLLVVLSSASAEDRSAFWDKYWCRMVDIMDTKNLDRLMSVCFGNDKDKIAEAKLNSVSILENVREKCASLLNRFCMQELNEFLEFCFSDNQTRKNVRLDLLLDDFKLDYNIIEMSPSFNDFINDAYGDVNLASDFKTQLLFSPSTFAAFTNSISQYHHMACRHYRDASFIDILAPSEQVAREFKRLHIRPLLMYKFHVHDRSSKILFEEVDFFTSFIQECQGTGDEIAHLKETIPVDEIVQNIIRWGMGEWKGVYNSFLVRFLEWYFNTPQALNEFKAKYANDDVFVKLTTKSE